MAASKMSRHGLSLLSSSAFRGIYQLRCSATQRNELSTDHGHDFQVPVPWGFIAAKEWGKSGGKSVLAMHGLGDNLASFERLVPLLPQHWHIVAFDFPGFGLSPSLPEGAFPSAMSLTTDTQRVMNHLGWSSCNFIGHSLGGAIALMHAALFPEKVDRVVGLDTAKFICGNSAQAHHLLADKIRLWLNLEDKRREKSFIECSMDVATKQAVSKSGNSLTEDSARILLRRIAVGIDGTSGNHYGHQGHIESDMIAIPREPRNIMICYQDFTVEQGMVLAEELGSKVKILLIQPRNGAIPQFARDMDAFPLSEFSDIVSRHGKLSLVQVDGNHHVHLNNPEMVLKPLVEFLEK